MRRSAIEHIENKYIRKDIADFRTGDTVRVHWKVKEGDKERVQPFEGIVIRKTRGQNRATFTVRKISYGVGVERIFPLHSPRYERIEVLSRGDVNRNRLFYLRDLKGKASRIEAQESETSVAPVDGAAATPASTESPSPATAAAPEGEGKPMKASKKVKTPKTPKEAKVE
jgi:large subunit ribosomal protein L19